MRRDAPGIEDADEEDAAEEDAAAAPVPLMGR
jgi:hypothetical protein